MNNKEIEVKFKITPQIKEKILKDLEDKKAKHIFTYNLIDTYYTPGEGAWFGQIIFFVIFEYAKNKKTIYV